MSGIFYCGDNLEILNELVPAESIDLVYLDPPFNSQRTFNIVYKDSRAQAEAFKDHWSWEEAAPQYARLLEATETPPKLRTLLRGLRDLLIDDDNDLLAYLAMMAPRIFALHRVLKPTGSLYLHCDPTASHYLKLVLDAVFGTDDFRNEIIWKRTSSHNDARKFADIHDCILYYSRSREGTWNPQHVAHGEHYVKTHYNRVDQAGRRYRLDNIIRSASMGPRPNLAYEYRGYTPAWGWRMKREKLEAIDEAGRLTFSSTGVPYLIRYLDEMLGAAMPSVWDDIPPVNSQAAERLGYPTQKPLALLDRILSASTNPGDLVLDPFCGCGTTIEACERLGRRWIGIDIARKAVEITEKRFSSLEIEPPTVEWYPPDTDAAAALAARSGIKFEAWVRQKIRAARRRKHDRGIDGEAFFRDEKNRLTQVLISVKGGKLNPAMVRELRGTMERERAPIGALVTVHEPSKEMRLEATHAGFLTEQDDEGPIPRLQIVTIERLFSDRRPIRAPGVNVTTMPEPTVPTGEPKNQEQLSLRLEPPKPTAKVKKAREADAQARVARKERASEPPKSRKNTGVK